MTDKEIGKTARDIAERGNTAKVKKNKDGIVILEVEKEIAKADKAIEYRSFLFAKFKILLDKVYIVHYNISIK